MYANELAIFNFWNQYFLQLVLLHPSGFKIILLAKSSFILPSMYKFGNYWLAATWMK